jgi:hypothetical protein
MGFYAKFKWMSCTLRLLSPTYCTVPLHTAFECSPTCFRVRYHHLVSHHLCSGILLPMRAIAPNRASYVSFVHYLIHSPPLSLLVSPSYVRSPLPRSLSRYNPPASALRRISTYGDTGSTMQLLEVPPEIFQRIIVTYVYTVGIREAAEIRQTCSKFSRRALGLRPPQH